MSSFLVWSYNCSILGLIPKTRNVSRDFKVGYGIGALITSTVLTAYGIYLVREMG